MEGLLNPWQGLSHTDPLRGFLLYVWFLVGQAEQLVDPARQKLVFDNARRVFEIPGEALMRPFLSRYVPWTSQMQEGEVEQEEPDGTGEVSSTLAISSGVWL